MTNEAKKVNIFLSRGEVPGFTCEERFSQFMTKLWRSYVSATSFIYWGEKEVTDKGRSCLFYEPCRAVIILTHASLLLDLVI